MEKEAAISKMPTVDFFINLEKPIESDLNRKKSQRESGIPISQDKYAFENKTEEKNTEAIKKAESSSKSKIKGYFGGVKLITLLCEDGVPFISKIMIICSSLTAFTSFILYSFEIDTFSNSTCSEKKYVSVFIYINLLMLIPIMALVLSLFNLELINKAPYSFKLTFFRPWVLWGICPILELPLIVYDHLNCEMKSPLYTYSDSFTIINSLGIIFLIIFGFFIIFLACMMSGINCDCLFNCYKKVCLKYFAPLFLLALNLMSFLLTFTQINFFLPVFYFHNYVYYLMFLLMATFHFLLHSCKKGEKFYYNPKILEFSKIG